LYIDNYAVDNRNTSDSSFGCDDKVIKPDIPSETG